MFDDHGDALARGRDEPAEVPAPRAVPAAGAWVVPGVWPVRAASTSAEFGVPEVLVTLTEQLRGLSEQAEQAGSGTERAGWLVGLRALVDRAEVMFTDVLARFDANGDAPVMSAQRDAAAWLTHELRLSGGDARSRVTVARESTLLAAPLAAAAEGEIRFEHVRAISAACRAVRYDADQHAAGVAVLHDLAGQADPAVVRRAGRRISEVVDPDGAAREADRRYDRRYLHLSPLLDGMTALDGVLDPEAAVTVSAALAPLLVPAGPDDVRTAGQRRADALVEVAALALKTGDLPVLSGSSATVDLIVAATVATREAGHSDTSRSDSSDSRDSCGNDSLDRGGGDVRLNVGAGIVLDAPGGPQDLSRQTVERLLCDGSIGRILLGGDGVPLQLGRRVRLFTHHHRRALNVRDNGCRVPGCTRPPRYTDAHHLVPWEQGGCTDLTNALLLCRYHHTLLHRGGWQFQILDPRLGANGPLMFSGPGGQRIRSDPRTS